MSIWFSIHCCLLNFFKYQLAEKNYLQKNVQINRDKLIFQKTATSANTLLPRKHRALRINDKILLSEEIIDFMEKKQVSLGMFLDLSKKLDRNILLKKWKDMVFEEMP